MANGQDQYDIRTEQREGNNVIKLNPRSMKTAMEITGMSPEIMDDALRQAGAQFDATFEYEDFTEEDQQDLSQAQGVVAKNQPVQVPEPVQGLLPGNPFAVNLRNASAGIQNLVGSLVNEKQERELYGDPGKVERLTNRANQKKKKAQQLRSMAETYQQASGAVTPNANVDRTVQEILDDAQALEDAAAKDLEAAEGARGAVQRVSELEQQQQEAEGGQQARREFVQETGQEITSQALTAERESREQEALTGREEIRQKALTQRSRTEAEYGYKKAQVEAQAAARESGKEDPGWPTFAQPEYVQKFLPTYLGPIEDRISDLEDELIMSTGSINPSADQGKVEEYRNLQQIQEVARSIELDAITYEQLQEEGYSSDELPETSPPTPQQRQALIRMQQMGLKREMIEAFKFYNRISLNKAPQGSDSQQNQAPGSSQRRQGNSVGRAFRPENYGTGERLMLDSRGETEENE